jgi:hypothetical protein
MAIWMAVLLAAAGFPPDDEKLPRTLQADDDWQAVEGIFGVRAGVWTGRGFDFQSTRTDSTQATSKQQALFSASILGGVEFYSHFAILGTYETDLASKVTVQIGGAYLGWREHPKERYGKGVPDEVMLYAGALVGRFDVKQTDFGSFDRGIGFAGGLAFGWMLTPHLTAQFYAEYRYLKFDYKRDVLTGDTFIGGNSGWLGLGLDYRF